MSKQLTPKTNAPPSGIQEQLPMSSKFISAFLLLGLGVLMAGCYGMLHNQISCTISPEYFLDFKYHQFRLPEETLLRLGAAKIGWWASWWMGVLLGVPLVLISLFAKDSRAMRRHVLFGYALIFGLTLCVTILTAIAVQWVDWKLPYYHFPEGVEDQIAFTRAAIVHELSYLGGGLSGGIAWAYTLWSLLKSRRAG